MNWHHVASCHYHLLLYRSFTLLLYIVEGNVSLFYESFSLAAWVEMFFFFSWRDSPPSGPWSSPHSREFLWFLDHTQWHNTVGRTPLDEWSAGHRDLYLETHNTHNRQTSMPLHGIRTHDLSMWVAVDLHLRPGHWDQHELRCTILISAHKTYEISVNQK